MLLVRRVSTASTKIHSDFLNQSWLPQSVSVAGDKSRVAGHAYDSHDGICLEIEHVLPAIYSTCAFAQILSACVCMQNARGTSVPGMALH